MSIVSSISTIGHAQVDGRKYVTETHTDHLGNVYQIEFGPVTVANVDLAALRAARAATLVTQLADQEFKDRLTRVAALGLQHQTASEFATRLRELYRGLSQDNASRLAWWIIEMIVGAFVTDTQVRNAFGMTVGQYTTFKAKMQTLHDDWAVIIAAQGE